MDRKMIVIIGGVILIVGTFLPVVSGAGQSASFMMPGDGDMPVVGIIMAACGVLGILLAFLGHAKHAVWFGLIALGMVIWKFLQAKSHFDSLTSQISGAEIPPEFAAQLNAQMPSLNMLGWAVLAVGALVMLVGGAMAWKGNAAAPPPAAI